MIGQVAQLLFALAAGAALGFASLRSLDYNARLFGEGRVAAAVGLQCLRFGLLALGLFGLAKLGGRALLVGALALIVVRALLLRRKAAGT
jgi:hypothetical protein